MYFIQMLLRVSCLLWQSIVILLYPMFYISRFIQSRYHPVSVGRESIKMGADRRGKRGGSGREGRRGIVRDTWCIVVLVLLSSLFSLSSSPLPSLLSSSYSPPSLRALQTPTQNSTRGSGNASTRVNGKVGRGTNERGEDGDFTGQDGREVMILVCRS